MEALARPSGNWPVEWAAAFGWLLSRLRPDGGCPGICGPHPGRPGDEKTRDWRRWGERKPPRLPVRGRLLPRGGPLIPKTNFRQAEAQWPAPPGLGPWGIPPGRGARRLGGYFRNGVRLYR